MTVYVVMSGLYDNYGLYGVYESRLAAEAACSDIEYAEIHEEDIRGLPEPKTETEVDIARRELGLPSLGQRTGDDHE